MAPVRAGGCVRVSRRQEIRQRRTSLGEIRGIVNSMKTLAYLETRKLARLIPPQQSVMRHIERVAADFLAFHPQLMPAGDAGPAIGVVVGSERGFCGDFNRSLVEQMDGAGAARLPRDARLVLVGRRLHPLLEDSPRVAARLGGASVAEEIAEVLSRIVAEVAALRREGGPVTLYGLCHGFDSDAPAVLHLLPPFRRLPAPPVTLRLPPVLNVPPEAFLMELGDQYQLAALNAMLYSSLMAENHSRVSHLERAADHLEEQWREFGRLSNAMRQEEIIEEIEVILLSVASAGPGSRRSA